VSGRRGGAIPVPRRGGREGRTWSRAELEARAWSRDALSKRAGKGRSAASSSGSACRRICDCIFPTSSTSTISTGRMVALAEPEGSEREGGGKTLAERGRGEESRGGEEREQRRELEKRGRDGKIFFILI